MMHENFNFSEIPNIGTTHLSFCPYETFGCPLLEVCLSKIFQLFSFLSRVVTIRLWRLKVN